MVVYGIFIKMATFFSLYLQETLINTKLDLQHSQNQLKSVEGSTNKTGIRYKEKTGYVEWKGIKLKCIINPNDEVVVYGLSHRVKYCRIIKRIFSGFARFFVQLVLEGKPLVKAKNRTADNIVGLDIGPSTIAVVSDKQASLERFCDELSPKKLLL